MVDILLLAAFVALPIVSWFLSRSLLLVAVSLGLGVGIAGNLVQGTITLGLRWNVRGLQVLAVLVMLSVLGIAVIYGRRSQRLMKSLPYQFLTIVVPALVIGGFLIIMRLMAPGTPGPLTAIGYLINHPQAEDNAKWLHLTAQLADGRDISFSGYAGGPLLLLMAIIATLISVLSMIWLGGVNEVAVAANTMIGTQFLLMSLVPFAFAAFAERRVPIPGTVSTDPVRDMRIPPPLIWVGMLIGWVASAVVTSYGHLSFQFIVLVLAAWLAVFLTVPQRALRLAAALTVITTATVWLPLTIIALVIAIAVTIWTVRQRWWLGLGLTLVTVLVAADSLVSSGLYLLGLDASSVPIISAVLSPTAVDDASFEGTSSEVIGSAHLLRAPGATEITGPLLGLVAALAFLASVRLLQRNRSLLLNFAPVLILGAYVAAVALLDAVTTASSPNYSLNKLLFAFVVTVSMAYLPVALAAIDAPLSDMTAMRWAASGVVVFLLVVDSILPRALSAMSPLLWPTTSSSSPAYWSPAEVNGSAEQPLSSLPVACLFAPPISPAPTSLPLGQESYSCSRLLIGLNGLEDSLRGLPIVLQTDWLSQRSNWDELSYLVAEDAERAPGRSVVLMSSTGVVVGLVPLEQLSRSK